MFHRCHKVLLDFSFCVKAPPVCRTLSWAESRDAALPRMALYWKSSGVVRAYRLPRVELSENLALQFYIDGRGARLLLRVRAYASDHANSPFWHSNHARAAGAAVWPLDAVVPLQRLAQQILKCCRGSETKASPVCSDPGQQSSACPAHKGSESGRKMWGLTARQRATHKVLTGSMWTNVQKWKVYVFSCLISSI